MFVSLGCPGVDDLAVVFEDQFHHSLGQHLLQRPPSERRPYLQSLRDHCRCDELVVGDLLVELVVGALVEQTEIVEFVPHFSLGPLLQESETYAK